VIDADHVPPAAAATPVVRIERMRRRHLRAVHRIDRQVYSRPWSMALYHQELGQPQSRLYRVARVEGTVVAYGGLMIVGPDGHVTSVAVDPHWQGRGIGARLLLALFRAGLVAGCQAFTLEVRASNQRAQELYRRFGLAPAGVRRNYYSDEGEDALVMWAHDVDQPPYRARLRRIEAGMQGGTEWEDEE
jgi:[ribosomal protein S18]-alanine N-acetyltransferase